MSSESRMWLIIFMTFSNKNAIHIQTGQTLQKKTDRQQRAKLKQLMDQERPEETHCDIFFIQTSIISAKIIAHSTSI